MAIKLASKPVKAAPKAKAKAAPVAVAAPAPVETKPARVYKLSESKRAYARSYMRDFRAGIRRRAVAA